MPEAAVLSVTQPILCHGCDCQPMSSPGSLLLLLTVCLPLCLLFAFTPTSTPNPSTPPPPPPHLPTQASHAAALEAKELRLPMPKRCARIRDREAFRTGKRCISSPSNVL
ncbi:hypothetical protein ABPG77_008874 [Micractinium sp. CCAP 211/92]